MTVTPLANRPITSRNSPLVGGSIGVSGVVIVALLRVFDRDGMVAYGDDSYWLHHIQLSPHPGIVLSDNPNEAVRRKAPRRSEEHTSELQSLMRSSYAVFCLKKKNTRIQPKTPQ